MKTLGILGGMGHQATAYFYEMLSARNGGRNCPNVMIYSKGISPNLTDFVLGKEDAVDPTEDLVKAVKLLERSGATEIVIPSALTHYFLPTLIEAVDIPVLNMLSHVAQTVADKGFTNIGLLAKEATVHADLYQHELLKRGIHTQTPPADGQAKMERIISCLEKGKSHDGDAFEAVAEELYTQGAEGIILGCTELSLISRGEAQGFIDSLNILTNVIYQ